MWDGTPRVLASWTPSQPTIETNALTGQPETVEGTPVYGIYMVNLSDGTMRPVVTAPAGYAVLDPVAIQPRPVPNIIADKSLDSTLATKPTAIGTTGVGILNVKSVYDTDSQGRMGSAVLVSGESIPMLNGVADLARLKNPALTTSADQRPARFVRITRAIPTQSGISREAIGETEFEMQQILGYADIEPDGSFKIEVPADIPVAIAVVDKDGRAFTPHTSWVQVRPGETRTCNGCHSPRRGNAINAAPIAGNHPNTLMAAASGESMAETRTRIDARVLALKPHLAFTDVWTNPATAGRAPDASFATDYSGVPAAPSNGVIDYPTHIAPIWTASRVISGTEYRCTRCHNNNDRNDPISRGLNLYDDRGGTGRATSYEELMVGDPILDANGLPVIDIVDDELVVRRAAPQVEAGNSRASHLVEVLFHQELRATAALPTAQNHSQMLNASEKRLVAEWIDLGGQYYNSPRDGGGALRGVSGLSRTAFDTTVHPILLNSCGTCHRAVGADGSANPAFQGQRFVLTGQAEGDFNATLSMISDISDPAGSYLLRRASSLGRPASGSTPADPVHPQVGTPPGPVLPAGSTDYNAICVWISGSNC